MRLLKKISKIISQKILKPIEVYQLEIHSELHPEQSKTIDCQSNQTILQALLNNKIDITYYCNGSCSCGSCRIEIISGTQKNPASREKLVLGEEKQKRGDRLACQTFIHSNTHIKIPKFF
jgi:ferredoxin